MDLRNQVKHFFRMCGHAMVSTVHERLDRMEQRANEVEGSLLQASIHTVETLQAMTDAVVVHARQDKLHSPELGLMEFLYSFLPERNAMVIGASTGETCAALLETGYEVYAFESDPMRFRQLEQQFNRRAGIHIIPADLPGSQDEPLATLAEPHAAVTADRGTVRDRVASPPAAGAGNSDRRWGSGEIPESIGLLRIDGGVDSLDAIRRMGARSYSVVAAGYRDRESRDSLQPSAVESLVQEMRGRDYPWHLVLYRPVDRDRAAFYSNVSYTVPYSTGSIFFFGSHETFFRAYQWCQSILPVTYFGTSNGTPKVSGGKAGENR